MAKCHVCLLGLIILCSFFKGTSGVDETHVLCSSGENVRLPCNNALSGCTSTTWTYNKYEESQTDELITLGQKKNNIERHERLSLGSDCSLNIKNITQEDYGLYTCQQFVNGQKQGTDARVYLHVLVSSSSSQTEIRPGSSVTLSCQLYYYGVSCDILVRTEGLQLIWVNQAGVSVMTDSRYQISFSPKHCISNLTLRSEDLNRDLRCLIRKNELKTSTTKSNKNSAQSAVTPVILVHTTPKLPTLDSKEEVVDSDVSFISYLVRPIHEAADTCDVFWDSCRKHVKESNILFLEFTTWKQTQWLVERRESGKVKMFVINAFVYECCL
ncbi:uncharacterized protein LOC125243854 isoform X2 [Megalobrama amblycephala]|uniref:uncharacterized protein LOC125243854 isoform X2 n=1 Tax=Megalobrama amblycephala TaxID=75352 RepID=UPI002013F428|nr:uncharacterized protein LOC125243854 isoform X2 [Megalobrama amblycephala]